MERRAIQGAQMGKPAQGPNTGAELASLRNRAIKRRPAIRRTAASRLSGNSRAQTAAERAARQNADGFVTVLRPKRRNADGAAHRLRRLPPSAAGESPELPAAAIGIGNVENLTNSST